MIQTCGPVGPRGPVRSGVVTGGNVVVGSAGTTKLGLQVILFEGYEAISEMMRNV